jgi:hypothetical protein
MATADSLVLSMDVGQNQQKQIGNCKNKNEASLWISGGSE